MFWLHKQPGWFKYHWTASLLVCGHVCCNILVILYWIQKVKKYRKMVDASLEVLIHHLRIINGLWHSWQTGGSLPECLAKQRLNENNLRLSLEDADRAASKDKNGNCLNIPHFLFCLVLLNFFQYINAVEVIWCHRCTFDYIKFMLTFACDVNFVVHLCYFYT